MSVVKPDRQAIEHAAEAIRSGGLVGMPTETVYGIAADAMNPVAVRATFELKGRPAENPLIVHLASFEDVQSVALEAPQAALVLAAKFWPGPLTLVLSKRPDVPHETTGGLETIAVRAPAHPVAQALLREVGRPLSAPSANRFMGLSPTRAQDIDEELALGLATILDGGPCEIGIESTVVDLVEEHPTILRLGAISRQQLSETLGTHVAYGYARKSPGMYQRHYSPRTPVRLTDHLEPKDAGLTFEPPLPGGQIQMSGDPRLYAARLYSALAELDRLGLHEIAIERPPQTEEWAAIADRLAKAAGQPFERG